MSNKFTNNKVRISHAATKSRSRRTVMAAASEDLSYTVLCVLRSSFPQLNSVDKFYKGQNEKYEHCISIGYLPEETSFESEKRESSTWYLNHLIQCKKHSPTWIEAIIAKVIGSRLKVC